MKLERTGLYTTGLGKRFEVYFKGFGWGNYPITDLILLKRPLSSITDEDAIEVVKIASLNLERSNTNFPAFKKFVLGYCQSNGFNHNVFQFLQSKGYDLPHYLLGGKTLKEAGLAIYQEDIK